MVYTENGMYTAVQRRAPHPKLSPSQIGVFFLLHPVYVREQIESKCSNRKMATEKLKIKQDSKIKLGPIHKLKTIKSHELRLITPQA